MENKISLHDLPALGRRYWLVFGAGLLSDIGGFNTHTALALHIYKLSGQNAAMLGLSGIAGLLPLLLASSIGGALAEKYSRRRIMIFMDLIRIPLVLMMITTDNVWLIMGLNAALSAATAIFHPSRQSIIPGLVREDQVHLANTVNGGSLSLVHVLGPVIGAFLYARYGSMTPVVLLDASTYLFSAFLLWRVGGETTRRESAKGSGGREGLIREIVLGFQYVRSQRDLIFLFLTLLVSHTAIGLMIPLLRPFASEVLRGVGNGDKEYGYMIACFGIGGLIGPFVGMWAGRRLGLGRTVWIAFMIEAVLMAAWSRTSWIHGSHAILVLWGINVFMMIPCYMSYVHTFADPAFMGRTFSLFDQAMIGPQLLGAAVIAMLGNKVPTQALLTAAALIYLVIVLLTSRTPGARLLRGRTKPAADGIASDHPGVGAL